MTDRSLLRFLTCGSVDDGKSTLIGRLLYDARLIFDDQLAALREDSRNYGTTGDDPDFALLMDGLEVEREQSITIDVAYRYFSTDRRSFIVADTPGHEQYTRNMATGASTSDLAVIMTDARTGVQVQARRHAVIASLFGTRLLVLAVNKIDLVGFSEHEFNRIAAEFRSFAEQLSFESIVAIPISARFGDNVVMPSPKMRWYRGPRVLEYLEAVDVEGDLRSKPMRFPIQLVSRPHLDFRGYAGTIVSGSIRPDDPVVVARSGVASRIARIITADGDLAEAAAGDAVTITLAEEVDVARGDLLARSTERPQVADQFAAKILWMSSEPLLPGRSYLMRIGSQWTGATISLIKHKLDVHDLKPLAARTVVLNEVGFCNISTTSPV